MATPRGKRTLHELIDKSDPATDTEIMDIFDAFNQIEKIVLPKEVLTEDVSRLQHHLLNVMLEQPIQPVVADLSGQPLMHERERAMLWKLNNALSKYLAEHP